MPLPPDNPARDGHAPPDAEYVLSQLDSLPTLRAVAVQLLQVATDADSAAADVIRVLRGDQSLTAKVLSVAGSAWAGVRTPVTTLEKAVPLLGFSNVRNIVLAVSIFECFPAARSDSANSAFDREEFWKHALGVACASQRLAEKGRGLGLDPKDAFVAGLLHDIGKVALSAAFPKAYDRIATQADHARGNIADFEREVLGVDHAVAARRLMERWRLPRELQEAAWLHHLAAETLPASVSNPALIRLVQLADTLIREQRIGYSGNHTFYEHSPRLAGRLGLSEEQLHTVARTLFTDIAQYAELLGLDRDTPEALYVKAMSRANAELGRLNLELAHGRQRLAAGARYFQAVSVFDQQLGAWADPAAVVAAMTRAAAVALERSKIMGFGLRDDGATLDLCWISDGPGRAGSRSQAVSATMAEWLRDPGEHLDLVLARTPGPVPADLQVLLAELGTGAPWLVPIVRDRAVMGGIAYRSESDERTRLAGEAEELRRFVAGLGLALERAHAQAAARRLSDELSEANRRLQHMHSELLRSRSLSMIAEMAAGAGHELNSPLTVISGRAQMLEKTVEDAEARRVLNLIHAKAQECSRIISELMEFARPRPPRLERVGLLDLLSETRREWLERSGLSPSRIELEVVEATGASQLPLQVYADREQAKTVFRELLANASDAVADNAGRITIRCRPAATDSLCEVVVHDTGCGMPPSVLQRAFDPFFSNRRAGRGRGLGLSRAYRIVESHGGRIWLESQPNQGTTAHVRWPCPPPQVSTASAP